MKKLLFVLLLIVSIPAASYCFLDDIVRGAVKDAVRETVKETVKDAKNEAVKSSDEDLAAVVDQVPVALTPAAVLKAVKAALIKEFKYEADDLVRAEVEYSEDGDGNKYNSTITVQSAYFTIIITSDTRSKVDEDSWLSDLKGMKQYGDVSNSVYGNVLNWSPYAAKPYIILVLAVNGETELKQDYYTRTLKAIKTVFPGMLTLPSSLWLITE